MTVILVGCAGHEISQEVASTLRGHLSPCSDSFHDRASLLAALLQAALTVAEVTAFSFWEFILLTLASICTMTVHDDMAPI